MADNNKLRKEFIPLQIDGVQLRIASTHRQGGLLPFVFLHGFGSTKEDYADVASYTQFEGRSIVAVDAPGCGETDCDDLSVLSIGFLQQVAECVLETYNVDRFHLVGHSMGGLTALMLALNAGDTIVSFSNIKGNLTPEDCFLSRQILDFPSDDPNAFMAEFVERTWQDKTFSSPLYAAALPCKVRADAIAPIFRSMVDLSDSGGLLDKFTQLQCARMFVFGDQYRFLSYLDTLSNRGVLLAEIGHSGHFPMYSNPPALWAQISQFIEHSEMEHANE